jgi:hypothetical protein
VKVSVDADVRTVSSESMPIVVGQYAKVRLVAGSLIVTEALQPTPLVAPDSALVAITVPAGQVPIGLRERSHVGVVVAAEGSGGGGGTAATPATVDGRVVGLPSPVQSSTGQVALTLEVGAADATVVATAAAVRLVLLDPGIDPAAGATPTANGGAA